MRSQIGTFFGLAALVSGVAACADARGGADRRGSVGTPEMRAELFDTVYARIERREAFSTIKNERLRFDPLREVAALRSRVVEAETETDLYYALAAVSHARRDRHLDVYLVDGGLSVPDSSGLEVWGGEPAPTLQAPVRVLPDLSKSEPAYFVSDVAAGAPEELGVGDRVVMVDGVPVGEWEAERAPFMRHSTTVGLRWKLAEAMTRSTAAFPPELRSERLSLFVRGDDMVIRRHDLTFSDAATLEWTGSSGPHYPSHEVELATPTFDLLIPQDRDLGYVLLIWRGFRETMLEDVEHLMNVAQEGDLLDRAVVMDVTRSRGGSLGAYAMQRLQPRPFETTFGNLRISDVIEPFVAEKRAEFAARDVTDGGVPETIDDGTWLVEWLETDVLGALAQGAAYTNDVPFKLAHAPKDSNGVLEPAPVHFRGGIGIISGPNGGSHLDQFVSIVVDNDLGPVVGLPPGGYSNTWEWEEILTLPGTDRPLIGFMYSIGHTIRPNGEVLEGNPAAVDEWLPVTPSNVREYYPMMLDRVRALMEEHGR